MAIAVTEAQPAASSRTTTESTPTEAVFRLSTVKSLTGLSGSTIWRMRRRGEFPAPMQLSPGTVGWRSREVLAWIQSRPSKL